MYCRCMGNLRLHVEKLIIQTLILTHELQCLHGFLQHMHIADKEDDANNIRFSVGKDMVNFSVGMLVVISLLYLSQHAFVYCII